MGIEVTDICMDKESDCVIIYSKGDSHDSDHEAIPNGNAISESFENISGEHECQILVESSEVKEFVVVKECTTESISELCHNEKSDKKNQNVVNSDLGDGLPEEKVHQDLGKTKDQTKSGLAVNLVTIPASATARTKHTVPQPFALATERRASSGTRPIGAVPDASSCVNKASNINNAIRHYGTAKKTQVMTVRLNSNI